MSYANKFKLENLYVRSPLGRYTCRWEYNIVTCCLKAGLLESEYTAIFNCVHSGPSHLSYLGLKLKSIKGDKIV
jgi:hypothetical protein